MPSYISSGDPKIQIVGPSYGRCCSITRGAADRLQNNNAGEIICVCVNHDSNIDSELKNADGSAFLFLHEDHTNKNDVKKINQPVAEAMFRWAYRNPDSENIVLIYEGIDGEIVHDTEDIREPEVLCGASEKYVDKGQLSELYDQLLGHCTNFNI